jgi:TetR/AcrR family transcriptional regulator, transcriptional repressor for nem operon
MGYSKAQKARTHKRIVAIASKRFREAGLAGFGIAELMKGSYGGRLLQTLQLA